MARMWFIETAACDREWGVTVNDLRRVSEFECRSSDASTDTKHSADNCNQSGIGRGDRRRFDVNNYDAQFSLLMD
ncbi:uncharacterized protein [Physcomitrium patens]|uniref:uncharacterized protein isoform X3 n=1 Tax=Physcomitrium patens TaxID=3218 RepID=UPI003CCE1D8C